MRQPFPLELQHHVRVILGGDQNTVAFDLVFDLLLIEKIQGLDQLGGGKLAQRTHLGLGAPQQNENGDRQADGQPQDQRDLAHDVDIAQKGKWGGFGRRDIFDAGAQQRLATGGHHQLIALLVSHDLPLRYTGIFMMVL